MPLLNCRIVVSIFSWYVEACEHNPQHLSVDQVLCVLAIDEAHVHNDYPNTSEFLRAAQDEEHDHCCGSRGGKTTIFFVEHPFGLSLTVGAEPGRDHF